METTKLPITLSLQGTAIPNFLAKAFDSPAVLGVVKESLYPWPSGSGVPALSSLQPDNYSGTTVKCITR